MKYYVDIMYYALNQLRNQKGRGGHQKDYTLITDYTDGV